MLSTDMEHIVSESALPAQSQITTANLDVEATDGVTYRYRRFGTPNESNLPPTATMTRWSPLRTPTRWQSI